MRRLTASALIVISLSLGMSGTALAQSGTTHAAAKRCPTRACRASHARRSTRQADGAADVTA